MKRKPPIDTRPVFKPCRIGQCNSSGYLLGQFAFADGTGYVVPVEVKCACLVAFEARGAS